MVKRELSESLKTPDDEKDGSGLGGNERAILITIALATTLAPLNSTMIAIALPRLAEEFGANVASVSWLVIAYLVTMASLQPIAGKLGDRFGRRRLMLVGLLGFGLASLGAALAGNLTILIFFRIQQAIAGAIALPNGVALIREVVPAARRAGRFGLVGAAAALAAAAGPPLGGLLVGIADWRAIFYINLLIVPPALILGWRTIPKEPEREHKTEAPFDLAGSLLLLITLVATVGLLTQSRQSREFFYLIPGGIIIAVIATFFLRRELRHPDPILQPRYFRQRAFAAANGSIALSNLAMYTTLLTIPILLSEQPGWTSARIGLALTALSAATVIFSPLGGRLADRFGRRWPTVGGLALGAIGAIILALTIHSVTLPVLLGGLGLVGVGLGLASAGMQTAAVESVSSGEAGVAAGIYSTSRYLGSIVGSSLMAVLLVGGGNNVSGFDAIYIIIVVAAILAVATSLGLHDYPPKAKLKAA